MRYLIALLLVSAPAFADPMKWGSSSATAVNQCRDDADYCIVVQNRLAYGANEVYGIIQGWNATFGVHVLNGPGVTPDLVEIIPPAGWTVEPKSVVIPENEEQIFVLTPPGMS